MASDNSDKGGIALNTPRRWNVLAIGAHPDDVELLCGGTLARYALAGHRVTIAIVTDGSMGDFHIPPAELSKIRHQEALAAAAVIQAELIWIGLTDEFISGSLEERRRMIDVLRRVDPDIIFTHAPTDYHPDHRYTAKLVFDAYFQKGLPHIPGQTLGPCRFAETQVYYMDTVGGIGFTPTDYVDITEVIDLKRRMLQCHASQVGTTREKLGRDLLELMEIQAQFRGLAANCRYAEAFCWLHTWQRGITYRVLP